MFYEPSEIKDVLNCEHCFQPYGEYHSPRILPCCAKTICYRCVQLIGKQVFGNNFTCLICNEDEIIPKNGFKVNNVVVKLIAKKPKEISRGNEAEKLKQSLRDLEKLANKLIYEVDNGEYLILDNFRELRRQVQLAKEEKIQEINQQSDLILQKIETYEEDCINKYKEIGESKHQANQLIKLVNDSIEQQNAYLMQLKIDDKETLACNERMNKLKAKIEIERKNIKKSMFGDQIMKFEANTSPIDKELIGKLIHHTTDFSKIISASLRTIKLLDLKTGECLKTFIGHSDLVYCVKLLNESQIVSCSQDKTIKLWDLTTGNCIQTFLGHSDGVWSIVQLSSDKIASCSKDSSIRIWDVESGRCIKVLNGHTDSVISIVKLSSERIISGSKDKTIKLWNINSGECIRTFEGHLNTVVCLESLPNERILSGSYDNSIKVWNLNTGDCLQTLRGHMDWVLCLKVLSEERIISSSKDKTIRIWCLKTNSCIKTINGHSDQVREIQVLSDQKVASCSLDNTIKIWNLASASFIKSYQSMMGIFSIDLF